MPPEPAKLDATSAADGGVEARILFPLWKKILLSIAGVFVAGGLAMVPFESDQREELATSQSLGEGEVLQGGGDPLHAAGSGDDGQTLAEGDQRISPALLKMGFSFFAAFAVGLAFRSFVKLAVIFIGLQLLGLFGLSYVEWVTVNWEAMSTAFDRFVTNVEHEAQSFQSFITGSLPQAGLAMLGLVAGFKR